MKKLLVLFPMVLITWLDGQTNDDWPMWRLDRHNTGVSNIIGPFVEPSIRWKFFLGGSVGQSVVYDLNSDNQNENIVLAGGKIMVFRKDGSLMWQTPPSAISRIEGVYDFDNNGKSEILASSSSPPTLFIYSGETGNIAWKHQFSEPAQGVGYYGIVVDDLDNSSDGKLEIFCWPSISSYGFAFSFASGVSAGKELWRAYASEPGDGYIAPVTSADIDADGQTEVVIATKGSIYIYDGSTGETEVRFAFQGGKTGRNYGILNIINLDEDDLLEIVMLAENLDEHVSVIDNTEAGFNLLWKKYYEYSYPEDNKELRFTVNSVSDFDQDGNLEIAGSIYNDTGDDNWHLIVFDALTGNVELDQLGYYYWGAQDIDADGTMELIVGQESSRKPQNGNLEALEGNEDVYSVKWSAAEYSIMINPVYASTTNINATSGKPEVFSIDYDDDGISELLFYKAGNIVVADGSSSELKDEVSIKPSSSSFNLVSMGDLGGVDKSMEFVLTGSDGMLRVLTTDGSELTAKEVGTYKKGKPIVADLDSDGNKEILVQDASGKINVLSFDAASSQGAPDLLWTFPGFGKMAKYGRSFTPLVSDLEGDGKKEILVASTSNQTSLSFRGKGLDNLSVYHSKLAEELHELNQGIFKKLSSIGNTLVVLDHTGAVKRQIVLPDQPFEWNVGNFDGDEVLDIFVSYYAGGMHVGHSRVYSGKEEVGILWESDIAPYSGYAVIYDMDLDGIDDILLKEHFDLRVLSGVDGKDLIPIKSIGGYHTPILMDVNNDGDYEIISGGGYLTVLVNEIARGGTEGKEGNVWVDDFVSTSENFPVWNGGFENDNDYNGKADHWEDAWVSDQNNAFTSIDKTQSYSGNSSLKITTRRAEDYIYNYQAHVTGFNIGESYSFKAMMKTDISERANTSAFIYARARDLNGAFISHSVSDKQLKGVTGDWEELTLDFTVPDKTHYFNIECVILRGGEGNYEGPLACPVLWQNSTGYNDAYARIPGTADSDGDGITDILVSSTTGVLTLYDGSNGGTKWSYNLGTTASDIVSADIDKDRRYEYIFGGTDGFLYALNGEKRSRRIVVQYDIGSEVGDPIIADLDKDGRMEVLFAAADGYLYSLEDDITTISVDENNSKRILPEKIGVKLRDVYPNPFNSSTVIEFDTQTIRGVTMDLYAITGRKIRSLYSGRASIGAHKVNWNGRDCFGSEVSSGIYLVVLNDGLNVQTKRIALIR